MAEVDKHSETWSAIKEFIEHQRKDAIDYLIADQKSDQQRGALIILERLEKLAEKEIQPTFDDGH